MVLTDLTFDHCKLLHGRYDQIRIASSGGSSRNAAAAESKEYASFLRALERKVGPHGFLDSKRYTYPYNLKKEHSDKTVQAAKLKNDPLPENVVTFAARKKQHEQDFQNNLKIVEDHMWQHKHEERELKHTQGDIIKNLLALKHALQDYGSAMNARKQQQEKKLAMSLGHHNKISRDFHHSRQEASKVHLQAKIRSQQDELAEGRKQYIRLSHLEHQYRVKRTAVEKKKAEMMRISEEFESRLCQNEEDRYKLIRELAELSHLMSMESRKASAQKDYNERHKKMDKIKEIQTDQLAQRNLEDEMIKCNADIRNTTLEQGELDSELAAVKEEFDFKEKDYLRQLTNTQTQLRDNLKKQGRLKELAISEDQNLKAEQIKQKKGVSRQIFYTNHTDEDKVKLRFNNQDLELQRKLYEDSIRHFQALVGKETHQEQVLSNRVRNAEYSKQRQDQVVLQLKQNLAKIKRIHDSQISQDMIERRNKEIQLNQQLVREKSELNRVLANREENYMLLQKIRHRMREDKHHLEQMKKEHDRICKIGNMADELNQ